MSDLEHSRGSIPKVIDAAADADERARVNAEFDRLAPAGPEPTRDELAIHAVTEHKLPWPHDLHSRIVEAREAIQTLDLDDAIAILLNLEQDLGIIERREERVALRIRPQTTDPDTASGA